MATGRPDRLATPSPGHGVPMEARPFGPSGVGDQSNTSVAHMFVNVSRVVPPWWLGFGLVWGLVTTVSGCAIIEWAPPG